MKQRIITAVAAGAVFLPIVIYGGWPFATMVYLIAAIAFYETLKMKGLQLFTVPGIISLLLLWTFMIPERYSSFIEGWNYTKTEVFVFGILLLLTHTVITKNRFTYEDAAFSILSILYVGIGFYYFIEDRKSTRLNSSHH